MYSQYLPVFKENAEGDIAELLPKAVQGKLGRRDTLFFCQIHRIAGIASLLLEGDVEGFLRHLQQSGRAFLDFLKHEADERKVTNQAAPFLDAIAALDLACAREIAQYARSTWNPQEEYEDDFLYVYFLMSQFFLNGTQAEGQALLNRYEALLAGDDDSRYQLCQAFFKNDAPGFEAAMRSLLEHEKERFGKLIRSEVIAQESAATEAKLNVEGLALLRLAQQRGFPTQNNYLFIPSLARKAPMQPYDPDAWKMT
jgi:hypothetical protein